MKIENWKGLTCALCGKEAAYASTDTKPPIPTKPRETLKGFTKVTNVPIRIFVGGVKPPEKGQQ